MCKIQNKPQFLTRLYELTNYFIFQTPHKNISELVARFLGFFVVFFDWITFVPATTQVAAKHSITLYHIIPNILNVPKH